MSEALEIPPPHSDSAVYMPRTDAERRAYMSDPLLYAARSAGLTEGQVIALLVDRHQRVMADMTKLLTSSTTPLRIVVPA